MKKVQKNNSSEERNNPLIVSLLVLWDDETGPQIIDIYPKADIGDPERLAIHIFTIYQFFWDKPDSEFQRANISIPIAKLDKLALTLFDIIPNPEARGGFQPFIIVFIIPEYTVEEQLKIYKTIQTKISQEFLKNRVISLKDYYQDIIDTSSITEKLKEPVKEIDEYYSYTAAMEDFQAAIKLFQTKNFDQAYSILKKVLLKFELESHKHLIMEVLYLIGTLLTQQKRFKEAEAYFYQLEKVAEDLNHQKYLELTVFMKGFFEYKKDNYASAKKIFAQIDVSKSKYINKMHYYLIYGKIFEYFENYEFALKNLSNALKIAEQSVNGVEAEKRKSQILYEIGAIHYKIAVKNRDNLGFTESNAIQSSLKEAIKNFLQCTEILVRREENEKLISMYQIIGDLHQALGDDNKFLEYYTKAMDYANKKGFIEKKVQILNRVIQKLTQLKRFEENISLLQDFFIAEKELKFIDLYTISILQWHMAKSLLSIGKISEGLSMLTKSYEIIQNFKIPVHEEFVILKEFIRIYDEMGDHDKVISHKIKLNELYEKADNYYKKEYRSYYPLAPVKEIWIYSTSTGVGLYNYSPESKVDIDLLGGLMIAMQQFSMQLSQQELHNMDIGEDRYIIYKEKDLDFFILGRSNVKIPIEIVEQILCVIYRRFWKEYTKEIKFFRGNVSIFRGFTNIIENLDLTLIK